MKPLVIYLKDNSDEVKITRKEFEKLINDAYQQGYDQGYVEGRKHYWYGDWWRYNYTTSNECPPTILNPNKTSDPFKYDTTITCEANNALGE